MSGAGISISAVDTPLRRFILPAMLLAASLVLALGWLAITKTAGSAQLSAASDRRVELTTSLTGSLTRKAQGAGTDVDVILTPPAFFEFTGRVKEAAALGADRWLVFVVNENVHYGELPHHLAPILRVDANTVLVPSEVRVLTDAVHHRTSALVFADVPATLVDADHTLELLVSAGTDRAALQWRTPLAFAPALQAPEGISLGLIGALAAGLLAAISPCLLQLTGFFLPTLAGISADAGAGAASRRRLVPTAALFVAGFTIPYTAGGALMGGFGAALGASGLLNPTGPIAEGAGVVMIAMAVFVAYRARAPLVCELPLPRRARQDRHLPLVTAFASGFAIATGCLACFGGAILAVLLVYTGLLGSAMLGALAMLGFSLGLAIPFLLAAFGLSRVEGLVATLQRARPAIGLAAGAGMLFFGLTMATGNYHVVSGWLFQHLPLQ